MKIKKNDLFIGIYLLAAVLFFIISIPSWLLDILLAINILVAMVVLFNSLFAKEVLDMASFPTMLLFTTIFRISLNVSSTKLILKNGDAGKVVDTFGKFVGGGNLVIGIIIFIILIIVQFIVINKGSERVAEVTARFTLDAMAGKQMAIDSDLNTGAITDKEAAERRKKLQQENSFFGSMDGATKYVKGDATAGLIITGINLVGGIVMGMVYGGLSINDALSKYTILTIGDGLSSQIPSLLISLATGILVTKASSDGELGDEIVGQLFSMDRVLIMVGAALSVLGILTPLPWYIFVPLGAALIFYGRKLGTKAGEAKIEESAEQEENEAQEIRKPENVVSLLNVDPIELEFGYGIIPLADVNQGGDLLDRVVMIRRQIALELGAVVPIIRLRDNIQLNPNQYVIKIKGIQVSEGEILFDHYMAMNPGYVEEEITGIPTFEPSFHLPAIWITESQRERAESLGYTVVDPPSIIATHLTEVIRQHIAELLTRQDVQNLINNIKDNNSTLIDELVPKLMGIGEIQKVLQNLLEEGISIRDLVTILETLADHAAVTRDPDILTEYARQGLKRAISSKYFTVGEVTNVVTVDPAIEQEIMNSVKNTEQGSYLSLDPERSKKIVEALGNELKKLEDMGKNPIVITSPIVRMYFRNLAKDYYKDIIVISYNEVESYEGDVVVKGNVLAGFTVKATGDITVSGIVEGATVIAGGNITFNRGIQGMTRAVVKAGGNIVSKFIESAENVSAGGSIEADSILHSKVTAKSTIKASGRNGLIIGGDVKAVNMIEAKTIGNAMGTNTSVGVGVDPSMKRRVDELKNSLGKLGDNKIQLNQLLNALRKKQDSEGGLDEAKHELQMKTMRNVIMLEQEINKQKKELEELRCQIGEEKHACIKVSDAAYAGVKLTFGDQCMFLKQKYDYCQFVKEGADIKSAPI